MASLAGVAPKNFGESGIDTGWYRVITDVLELKYVGANKTPMISQKLFTIGDSTELKIDHFVSEKGLPFFAGYADCCGCDDAVRATMDAENPSTLSPMIGKTLWVMVDFEQNPKDGKWYRRVTAWAPDGDEEPKHKKPKHTEYPGQRSAPNNTASADIPDNFDEDDVPF